MAELADHLHQRIVTLNQQGDELADRGDFPNALDRYWDAFDLLPEPKTQWEAGTRLLGAIGDANFLDGSGRENLSLAMHFPRRWATRSCICDWASASSSWEISIAPRMN